MLRIKRAFYFLSKHIFEKFNPIRLKTKVLIFFILSFSSQLIILGQGRYTVKIILPSNIHKNKIHVSVDDGKGRNYVLPDSTINETNSLTFSGLYYIKYAVLSISYPKNLTSHFLYQNTFYIADSPAVITFKKIDSTHSPFDSYALTNAYDFKNDKDQMRNNDSVEADRVENYIHLYGDKIFEDTNKTKVFFTLNKEGFSKDIKYIIDNGNTYYAFSYFRRNIISSNLLPIDSILHLFNTIFPDEFKNSIEGKIIRDYLQGKITVKKGGMAPDFIARDINQKEISLSSFRNQKYVLLIFWASWCGPCIAEIPTVQEIQAKYAGKELEIISIARNSDYNLYMKILQKYNITWTNIFNNSDIVNAYGGVPSVPAMYLIDKTGKIIYDRNIDEKEDSTIMKLPVLNQFLSKKIDK